MSPSPPSPLQILRGCSGTRGAVQWLVLGQARAQERARERILQLVVDLAGASGALDAAMNNRQRARLLLTLDAFGTIFTPREPVAKQYLDVARRLGLASVDEALLQTFKEQSRLHPNYGRNSGMKAPEWWANVIKSTFRPFTSTTSPLPTQLVPELLARFSSSNAYRLYPDVSSFFQALHKLRHYPGAMEEEHWPWDLTVVGVITNSDDRVPSILSSLGLRVSARVVQRPEQIFLGSTQFRNEDIANANPMESSAPRYLDAAARIDEDINFIVLSYDVGAEKPNPRIFRVAKDMLRLTLQDDATLRSRDRHAAAPGGKESTGGFTFLHVGDDVQKDVIGAQKAGLQSILLDRKGTYSQAFEESKRRILSVPLSGGDASTSHEMQVIQDLRDLRYWPIQR
ncbi:MAG: hypothetical protein M1840_001171 [Geoglossum simile]|nr:MAG: hypothetical protein M1840_001171 [Geoglossum simile]